jgi:hypothetical protein
MALIGLKLKRTISVLSLFGQISFSTFATEIKGISVEKLAPQPENQSEQLREVSIKLSRCNFGYTDINADTFLSVPFNFKVILSEPKFSPEFSSHLSLNDVFLRNLKVVTLETELEKNLHGSAILKVNPNINQRTFSRLKKLKELSNSDSFEQLIAKPEYDLFEGWTQLSVQKAYFKERREAYQEYLFATSRLKQLCRDKEYSLDFSFTYKGADFDEATNPPLNSPKPPVNSTSKSE